jgi:hypothetical protein
MKNFLFAFLILLPSLMVSQANETRFWIGAVDTNWTTAGNWSATVAGASSGDYPSGSAAIAKLSTTNVAITLNANITLKRLQTNDDATAQSKTYTITSSGGSTLTLDSGASDNYQAIQLNRYESKIKFACNVSLATTDDQIIIRAAKGNGFVSFLDGYTLTIGNGRKLILSSNNTNNNFYFKGAIVGDANTSITHYAKVKSSWAATLDMSNYLGNVIVNNAVDIDLTVNGPIKANQVQLHNNSTCTINAGGSVTSTGNLNTISTSKFIVKSGVGTGSSGSLIATENVNSINVDFINSIDDLQAGTSTREWSLIGVPVDGQTLAGIESQNKLSTKSGKKSIGDFNNATGNFNYYDTGATYTFAPGKGYLVSVEDDASTITFTGTMKNGNVSTAVTYQSGDYGFWNLVGNPYPSYLDLTDEAAGSAADSFLEVNKGNIRNTHEYAAVWDGSAYTLVNKTNNTIKYIAPGDGFFVAVRDPGGDAMNINFKENMQSANRGAGFNAASSVKGALQTVSRFNIELKEPDSNESDELLFYFSNKTSKGLDPGYDAAKFFISPETKIFTRLLEDNEESKGLDFQIQALSNDDLKDAVVPLGITTKSSKLELSIKENTLDHLYNVYLEDRLNNTIVEFDKSIELDFDKESEGVGRFYLHFTDGMIPELPTDGDDFRIFKVSNSEIRLMGTPETNYNAKVYDFSGRLVREVNFNHRININEIDSRGINILTIESNDKKLTKKFKLN